MISPLQAAGLIGAAPVALRAAGNLLGGLPFLEHLQRGSEPTADTANLTQASGIGLEQIQGDFQQQLDAFGQLVQQRLAEAGLPSEGAIEITASADGRIQVRGTGANAQSVESLLHSDVELIERVNALAAEHQLIAAAERHIQFAEQYAAGRIESSRLRAQSAADSFRLKIEGDSIEVTSS